MFTKATASSGPATAPRLSPARSSPNALPVAVGGARDARSESLAGERAPLAIQASARRVPACQVATLRPMAPVATAVVR